MSDSVTSWTLQQLDSESAHSAQLLVSLSTVRGGGVLEIAAAARLLFLGLNVFMNLEPGLIGMLDGAMLQLPEGQSSCGTVNIKRTTHRFISIKRT